MSTTTGTNTATTVIQSILSKISDGDTEEVFNNLSRLPIANIPNSHSETIIDWFLTECMKCNNTAAARIIIDYFDNQRIKVDPLPALTQLFINTNISREVLSFAIDCFPEKTALDFYVDLVNMYGDMDALKAAVMINTFFPNLPPDDWITLFQLTETGQDQDDEEYPNPSLRAFFETKVAETGQCVSKPNWVHNFPIVDIIPVPETIPSVKEAVDLLLDNLMKQNIKVISGVSNQSFIYKYKPEFKEQLISQYCISTITEKIHMLSPVKVIEQFDDIPIFREFGPVNTMYSLSPTETDHPCSKHGGCRMFTCTEFEQMFTDGEEIDIMAINEYNDYNESIVLEYIPDGQTETISERVPVTTVGPLLYHYDWFRKSCDVCLKPIPHRHYAIRKPLNHGGWSGCYCSFDCLKLRVTDENCAIMVGRMKEQLDVIGIRDR